MFSWTCSRRDAPVITVDTRRFEAHQASASCPGVHPSSEATAPRSATRALASASVSEAAIDAINRAGVSFYILKPWQGAGIAATLMDWAIAEARRRGAEEMFLSVFVDNARARRFYARYGFEQVGTYDFMVGTHADLDLVMRLKL